MVKDVYDSVKSAVRKLCKGYVNIIFIQGAAGIGKSYIIRHTLNEYKVEFVEITGSVTEAYLYRLIYDNNGKIIWFRDMSGFLQDSLNNINLLKSATETDKVRLLTKSSYSKFQRDLPEAFDCKCSFIFDFNDIKPKYKADLEALFSRGEYIWLNLSYADILNVMKSTVKTDNEKVVYEYLKELLIKNPFLNINLRTQVKANLSYKHAIEEGLDWKEEINKNIVNNNPEKFFLYSKIGENKISIKDLSVMLIKDKIVTTKKAALNYINTRIYCNDLVQDQDGFVSVFNI